MNKFNLKDTVVLFQDIKLMLVVPYIGNGVLGSLILLSLGYSSYQYLKLKVKNQWLNDLIRFKVCSIEGAERSTSSCLQIKYYKYLFILGVVLLWFMIYWLFHIFYIFCHFVLPFFVLSYKFHWYINFDFKYIHLLFICLYIFLLLVLAVVNISFFDIFISLFLFIFCCCFCFYFALVNASYFVQIIWLLIELFFVWYFLPLCIVLFYFSYTYLFPCCCFF